jgi:hypothetical protein
MNFYSLRYELLIKINSPLYFNDDYLAPFVLCNESLARNILLDGDDLGENGTNQYFIILLHSNDCHHSFQIILLFFLFLFLYLFLDHSGPKIIPLLFLDPFFFLYIL